MDYIFPPRPAVDPVTGALAKDAELTPYAPSDTGFTTPLTLKDPSGLPISVVRTNYLGLTETITSTDEPVLILKDGSFTTSIESPTGMLAATEAALALVQAAGQIAEDAVEGTVRFVDGNPPDADGNVNSSGGGGGTTATWATLEGRPDTFPPSGHTHLRSEISDATTVGRAVMGALDQQAARTAIGAGTGNGTSNLTIGTTATTAAPGNHTHSNYVDAAQAAAIADGRIAASGGGTGGGQILVWEYRAGAYPALPATKPAGVVRVDAAGPVAPSSVPSWIGPATTQARLRYDYDPSLT
jgi:hypothetical protein